MAKKFRKPNVVFKYRQSPILLKCAILAAIVCCTVALLVVRNANIQKKIEYDLYRTEAAQEEHRKRTLESYQQAHGTVEGIKRYAEVVLGLVDPDTVFFEVEPKD